MGVQIGEIVSRERISLQHLTGKRVAVDAHNTLYQFLSIIRSFNGSPLMDRDGHVTSHLSGLFYRTANLVEIGANPLYVFDGKPPVLKKKEIARRRRIKEEADKKYREALREGRLEDARRHSQATSRLEAYMINDSKRLLSLMGIPWVQAPSEGEAQTSYMASSGQVWAAASQDYDSLLFGADRLVRNITITGKRKVRGKRAHIEVEPEFIELHRVLEDLRVSREQLITLAILLGTDFNPNGIKGVGVKRGLALVRKYESLEAVVDLFDPSQFPVHPEEIRDIFMNPTVTDDYTLSWEKPDLEGIVGFLCGERDFSEKRVRKSVKSMLIALKKLEGRTSLERWF